MLIINFNSLILIVTLNKNSPRLLPPCYPVLASLTYLSGSLPLTRLILRLVRTKSNSVIQWFKTCNYNTPLSHFSFLFFTPHFPSSFFSPLLPPFWLTPANTSDGSPKQTYYLLELLPFFPAHPNSSSLFPPYSSYLPQHSVPFYSVCHAFKHHMLLIFDLPLLTFLASLILCCPSCSIS